MKLSDLISLVDSLSPYDQEIVASVATRACKDFLEGKIPLGTLLKVIRALIRYVEEEAKE